MPKKATVRCKGCGVAIPLESMAKHKEDCQRRRLKKARETEKIKGIEHKPENPNRGQASQ